MLAVYQWSFLLTAICVFPVGLFVLCKDKRSPVNRSWFALSCFTAFYAYAYQQHINAVDKDTAIFWGKLLALGAIPTSPLFFLFTSHLTKNYAKYKKGIILAFGISPILFWSVFANLFFKDFHAVYVFKYYPVPGIFFIFYMAYYAVNVFFSFYCLMSYYRQNFGREKIRTQYMIFAGIIGFFSGGCTFLPLYGLPSLAIFSLFFALYPLIISYAIVRHRLMDIEIIIKKTLVFAGLFGIVMVVVGLISTLTRELLGSYLRIPPSVSMALSAMIIIILYEPSKSLLVNLTDRYLFQKKEDIKIILNRLSENIITILDVQKVGEIILTTLKDTLRLQTGAIFVKDEKDSGYQMLEQFGIERPTRHVDQADPLIIFLQSERGIIYLENPDQGQKLPVTIQKEMDFFHAVLIAPLFFQKELIGILFLGKKKSDQAFAREEMDYFPTVASQSALALRNARMHDILMKSQIDFAQQAKMAAIGTLAAGIGHEIKNPLNNIRGTVGMLKLNRKHNLFEGKPLESVLNEIFEALDIIERNVDRASDVINRLQSFAKKPKELKVEKVNVQEAFESAIAFMSNLLHLDAIKISKEFQAGCYIAADKGAIEDVMLNLITNAAHAMKDQGVLTLMTRQYDSQIEISITDTGAGIPPENLDKIFDPFFTTKDTTRNQDAKSIKGTGLGLFIVREIIKRFNGTVNVKSEVGKGTTFHINFPAYIEA